MIPPHSDFRKNIDWIDNNFPREVTKIIRKTFSRVYLMYFNHVLLIHFKTSYFLRYGFTVLCTRRRMSSSQKSFKQSTNRDSNSTHWLWETELLMWDRSSDSYFSSIYHLQDFCFKVPILKFPEEGLLACNGKKKETESTMVNTFHHEVRWIVCVTSFLRIHGRSGTVSRTLTRSLMR